ncbi:Protein of unknown function DUF2946 [Methylophilaceae bacterium]
MFSKKLFRFVHSIALFAIFFASVAPSISHALAAQNNTNSFAQEICTTSGEKVVIQVLTTKGHQIVTELTTKATGKAPIEIGHHLQHCPFCANFNTDAVIKASHAPIVALLAAQAQQTTLTTTLFSPRFSVLPPPALAPPAR